MKKKAFITGINGQDGSYLAELLLEKELELAVLFAAIAPSDIVIIASGFIDLDCF